jgi:hypothetical protein
MTLSYDTPKFIFSLNRTQFCIGSACHHVVYHLFTLNKLMSSLLRHCHQRLVPHYLLLHPHQHQFYLLLLERENTTVRLFILFFYII